MDQQRKMYRYLAKSSQHVGEAGDTKPYMGALQVTRLTHVRAWVRRGLNTCVDFHFSMVMAGYWRLTQI